MDNFTDVTWFNVTDLVTEAVTELSNGTSLNVSTTNKPKSGGGGRPGIGYYGDTKNTLWKVVPPIILAWGLTGNFLTIIVLLRQLMKKVTSTTLYLTALALSDSVIILCGPLRNTIQQHWDKDVRALSDAGCRMQVYFTYASIHLSSWLLVAVTMERVLSVTLPHKVKLGCTPKMAGIVICVTVVCVFGMNVCIPITHGEDAFVKTYTCAPTSKAYVKFKDDIYQWMDFLAAFAIPFVFLLVGNIIIVVHLFKSMQRKKHMTSSNVSNSKTKSLSVLLILLCFVFFATMTPVSVFGIWQPYRMEQIQNLPTFAEAWSAYQYLLFQHTVVNLVGYTNATFNFLMYVLSGSKFRNELKKLLCICFTTKGSKATSKTARTLRTTSGVKSSSRTISTSMTVDNSVSTNSHGHDNGNTGQKYIIQDDKVNETRSVMTNNHGHNNGTIDDKVKETGSVPTNGHGHGHGNTGQKYIVEDDKVNETGSVPTNGNGHGHSNTDEEYKVEDDKVNEAGSVPTNDTGHGNDSEMYKTKDTQWNDNHIVHETTTDCCENNGIENAAFKDITNKHIEKT